MADSKNNTKLVTYKIVGDDTSLISTVEHAIKRLDAFDTKLARVSKARDISELGEGKGRDAMARMNSIISAMNKLAAVRDILNTTNVNLLTPEQVALIKTASKELLQLKNLLNSAGTSGKVTQEQLDKVNASVKKIATAFKNAGIAVVDYDAIAKQAARDDAKAQKEAERIAKEAEKERTRLIKERAAEEKRAAKEAERIAKEAEKERTRLIKERAAEEKRAAKEAKRIAKEAQQNYQQIIRSAVNTLTAMIVVVQRIWSISSNLMSEAADFGETMNKFNVVAGESAETLSKFADQLERTLGLDIADVYENVAAFKSVANSIGLATSQAELFTETFTKLSIDLSSLYNKSVERTTNALISGLHGLQKPLKEFNVYVYDANLEQTRLTYGINKNVSAMNEAEKVLLRYLTILDQSKVAYGDMSRTLGSAANQIRIFKAQLAALRRSAGQVITAIGLVVIPALNLLFSALSKVFTLIAKSLGYEIENFANIFGDATDATDDGTDAINSYLDAANRLSGLDEINLVSQTDSSIIDPDTGALTIDENLLKALKGYDNLMSNVTDKMGDMTDKIAQGLKDTLASDLFMLAAKGLKAIADALSYMFDNWDQFEPLLKTAINLLTTLVAIKIAATVTDWGKSIIKFAKTLKDFSNVKMPLALKNIRGELQYTETGVTNLTLALSALSFSMANAAASAFYDQFEGETKQIVAAIGLLVSTLTAGTIAWMAYHGSMTWGTALPIITAAIGAGIASVNAMMPKMATGGVVSKPTVAMIGEGRYNEAVVPLGNSPQFKTMKEDISAGVVRKLSQTPTYQADQLRARSGNTPIVLQVDGRELARALLPYLGYTQAQTGVKFK